MRHLKLKKLSVQNKYDSVGYLTMLAFPHWCRILIWLLKLPPVPYKLLLSRIMSLWRESGPNFLVPYLKECVRLVNAFVSGRPEFVTNKHVVALSGGLPSIIPGTLRLQIRARDMVIIRGVLTMLSVYRVIKMPGRAKLETISRPFSGLEETLPLYEVVRAVREIKQYKLLNTLKPITLKLLTTAGPNDSVSMFGLWKDIITWKNHELYPTLKKYLSLVPGGKEFQVQFDNEVSYLESMNIAYSEGFKMGKLSLKLEAAGKIRVFAITDAITQTVLAPLSDFIFDLLKHVPNDGTFDQSKPVDLISRLLPTIEDRGETLYSYDLSAATDRLPLKLQEQVLSTFLGADISECWGKILTQRDWFLKGDPFQKDESLWRDQILRYSVGQPMGALSSWAMLALTHHAIVRLAANRVGIKNFEEYGLLGDDIVIANKAVAISYHTIMTEVLGVEINLSKSLISGNSFEFAKRLVTREGEFTPVGPKNLLLALKSCKGLSSLFLDLSNKGYVLTEDLILDRYESIPTVRKSQSAALQWLVKGPFGFVPTISGLSPSVTVNNSLSYLASSSLYSNILEARSHFQHEIWERNVRASWSTITKMEAFVDYQIEDSLLLESPLRLHILDMYYEDFSKLLSEEPVKFDPTSTFTPTLFGSGSPMWPESYKTALIMETLTKAVRDDTQDTVSVMDPWSNEKAVLLLAGSTTVDSFWQKVQEIANSRKHVRRLATLDPSSGSRIEGHVYPCPAYFFQ